MAMEGLGGAFAKTGVQVVLDSDPAGIIKGFAEADTAGKKFAATLGSISSIGKAAYGGLQRVAAGFEQSARRVRNAGIGLGLSLVAATYGAMQLQGAMHDVATIDENVRNNFKQSTQTAIEMSRVLPASATDIAKAWYEIASSGFYGAEGTMVLNQALKAGTAGLSSTAEAGAALTAILNSYGMGAVEAQRISDLMFQTVNLGVVRFGELSGVVGDTVGTAAAAGVSFKHVGAALATMTLNGISASEAGTSLNRLIQSLIDPSEALSVAWSQISTQSLTMALRTQGLKAVMDQLRVASGGNIEVLLAWFDEIRAARGALALMNNEGATYTRIFNGMGDATKGAGATQRAFEEQMKSTSMQLKLLFNQFKSIGLEIGNALLPLTGAMIRTARIFLDAWNAIPGPIKDIIAHVAAFSSIIMTVAGVIAVFAARALAATVVTRLLGTGLERAGAFVTTFGQRWAFAGNAMTNAAGRIRASSGIFNIFAPFSGTITTLGFAFEALGRRISTSAIPAVTRLGTGVTALGGGLRNLSSLIPSLAVSIPLLATSLFLLASGFAQANQSADMWIQNITRRFDQNTVEGLDKGIAALERRVKTTSEAWNSWGTGLHFTGVSLKNMGENVNTLRASLAQLGSGVTNLLGFGTVFGNPAEDKAKNEKALRAYEDFIEKRNNILNASYKVLAEMQRRPGQDVNEWFFAGTEAQQARTQMGYFNLVSKAAKNMGVDLKNTKDLSKKELSAITDEVTRMAGKTGQSVGQLSAFGEAAVDEFKKARKAVEEFVTEADKSFMKGFDIAGAVTEKGKAGQKQLKDFFYVTVGMSGQFVADIEALMRKGLDPEVLMQLVSAGPEAANLAIRALLDDSSGQMIEFANQAIANMRNLRIQLARESAFIAKAAMNPQIAKDIGTALDIANVAQFLGVRATPEKIAEAMHLDPNTVENVGRAFDINMGARMEESAAKALWKFGTKFGPGLHAKIMEAADGAQISDQQAGLVFETLVTKGRAAAETVVRNMGLIPEREQILLDLIGWVEALTNAGKVGDKVDEVGKKHAKPKIDADIAGAQMALGTVIATLNQVQSKTITISVNDFATGVLTGVQNAANAVKGFTNAKGGMYMNGVRTFARGGENHRAGIYNSMRIFAEPETGGEAYIPLHHGRPTDRSLEVLDRVAGLFGFGLHRRDRQWYRFANGGMMGGGMSRSGGAGRAVQVNTTLEFSGNIAGEAAFREIAEKVIDVRDRKVAIAISRKG